MITALVVLQSISLFVMVSTHGAMIKLVEATDAKPEKRVTLKMHVEDTNSYPIDMDLCVQFQLNYERPE